MTDEELFKLRKPDEEFLIWFAGFLEADGHVSHDEEPHKHHRMNISQTKDKGKKECEMIQKQFGGIGTIREHEYEKDEWSKKYEWWLNHPICISKILGWIEPYLDQHTKLSGELEYYNIKETVPVWDRNQHFKPEQLEQSIIAGATTHNVIKEQYFPETEETNDGLNIYCPPSQLKTEFDEHYNGNKSLKQVIETMTDDLVKAIDDINIDVPHSLETVSVSGFSSDNGTVVHLIGNSEPGYIPISFNRITDLNIRAEWGKEEASEEDFDDGGTIIS